MTISYQLSSQKCLDEGWTVWPKIAATKYNVDLPKENETSRKSPESEVDEDADVVGHQVWKIFELTISIIWDVFLYYVIPT